jgi:RNA polymerase sigma-70 factor (ECF subfamily)
LVERASGGDNEAFAILFRRHAPVVIRFAQRRCGSSAIADDVTASAFEKAWRSLSSLHGEGSRFVPWVLRIAANELASFHRSEQRRDRRERVVAGQRPLGQGSDPADMTDTDDDGQRRLRQALDRLSPGHQEVVALRYLADLEPAEVATALGVSRGTAAVRLHRAMSALRREMNSADQEGGES